MKEKKVQPDEARVAANGPMPEDLSAEEGIIIERVEGGRATETVVDRNEVGIPRIRVRGLDVPVAKGPPHMLSGPRPSTVPSPAIAARAAAEKRLRENPPKAEPVKADPPRADPPRADPPRPEPTPNKPKKHGK